MKTRLMLFIMALLGIFGTGRLSEGQDSNTPKTGSPSTQKDLPPIDTAVAANAATATFALG